MRGNKTQSSQESEKYPFAHQFREFDKRTDQSLITYGGLYLKE
jgi:hypothetical protein